MCWVLDLLCAPCQSSCYLLKSFGPFFTMTLLWIRLWCELAKGGQQVPMLFFFGDRLQSDDDILISKVLGPGSAYIYLLSWQIDQRKCSLHRNAQSWRRRKTEMNGRFSHESVMGGGVLLPLTHEVGSSKIDRWPPLSVPKKERRSFSQKRERVFRRIVCDHIGLLKGDFYFFPCKQIELSYTFLMSRAGRALLSLFSCIVCDVACSMLKLNSAPFTH